MRDYYRIEDADGRRYWLYRAGLYGDGNGGHRHRHRARAPLVRARALWLTRAPRAVASTGPARRLRLQAVSNFSFLRGASHAEELVERAAALGLAAIGIADRNTLAGAVRAHVAAKAVAAKAVAAKAAGLRLLTGARLDLACGFSLLCYPRDRAAYGRLCRLLTLGQRRAAKGGCVLHMEDVTAHAEGQVLIALPPDRLDEKGGGGG